MKVIPLKYLERLIEKVEEILEDNHFINSYQKLTSKESKLLNEWSDSGLIRFEEYQTFDPIINRNEIKHRVFINIKK